MSQSKVGQLAKKVFFGKSNPGDDGAAADGAAAAPPAAAGAAASGPVTPKAAAVAGAWHSPRSGSGSVARSLSGSLARRSMGSLNLGEFKVRIGVCAMDKKANSKPMREIVSRLVAYGEFEVVAFGDELILNAPISEWPRVDCLMSWYSDGFPLAKAQAYADATRPFLINDLHMQDALQDRRLVYKVLQDAGIAVPNHIVVSRDGLAEGEDPPGFTEEEDWVELDGQRICKPFVEKPASGEDHNIHVYYPHSMGGGVKRLFRKVDNKSSCYDPHHPGTVRRTGSFIYEEFLATGGTDVKVYTVGPRYAHAEARKSPVVDGRVLRTADGKEMRFPVLLNPAEKEISRTVCLAFSQKVCGFDLLRSEKGRSYVCDVNGWSFVKNSKKYYDDAAGILRSTILSALAPHRLALGPGPAGPLSFSLSSLSPLAQQSLAAGGGDGAVAREQLSPAAAAAVIAAGGFAEEAPYMAKTASMAELSSLVAELSGVDLMEATKTDERSSREELRCVLAVIRHGDRTPKQKLKVRVRQPALLALFSKHADSKGKQAKLKSPSQLQELLDISRSLLQELERSPPPGLSEEELESREEQREKLRIVKTVLEQGGQFSGINRKVQLKPLTWATPAATTAAASDGAPPCVRTSSAGSSGSQPAEQQEQQAEEAPVLQEVLLILKYGGVLTHAGRAQAEELGKVFRLVMYPRYGSTGGGLLRLHSTYRHDLKIYSSDEGRVQVSAAAFTKGLLDLEGSSLTPILVSLVTKDASMLDAFGKGASEDIRRAKNILYSAMTWDPDTASSVRFEPNYSRSTTPLLTSPPMSPRSRAGSSGGGGGGSSSGNAGKPHLASAGSAAAADKQLDAAATIAAAAAVAAGVSQDGSGGGGGGGGNAAALPTAAGAPAGGGSGGGGHVIQSMPTNPLQHLRRLNDLMKLMVEQLRELVLAEKRHGISTTASSSAKDLLQAGSSSAAAAAAASAVPAAAGDRSGSISLSAPPPLDAGSSSIGGSLLGSGRRGSSSGSAGPPATPAAGSTMGTSPSGGGLQSPQRPSTAPPAGRRSRDGGSRDGSGGGSSCTTAAVASSKYSSLSCDPSDWQLEADKPCSGERLLLMFDRWQKLAKSFYKKGRFDISKVPDIYDSAKYDALHNSHLLGPVLADLYQEAKVLADAVIPNEYGIDPASKLAIGSKIATELLAKLLDDLRASKEESLATLTDAERSASAGPAGSEGSGSSSSMRQQQQGHDRPLGRKSMPHLAPGGGSGDSSSSTSGTSKGAAHPPVSRAASAGAALLAAAAAAKEAAAGASAEAASEEGAGLDGDEDFDSEPEFMHRLCPMYASDINSPLRHVRTRIYFTSESHMHSLVNLLRFCHLRRTLLPPTGRDSGRTTTNRTSLDMPRSSFDFSRSVSDDSAPTKGQPAVAAGGSSGAAANPAPQQQQSIPGSPGSGSSSLQLQPMGAASAAAESLLSEEALEMLAATTELDYLTHLVLRLYENTSVTADHPQRFRLEILFTPGTAWDPTKVIPPKGNHTLSPKPRVDLLKADGVTLADFELMLRPFAKRKGPPPATGSGGKQG